MIPKLDIKDRKDIIIFGIIILGLVLLFRFVYFPKSREVRTLNTEYRKIKEDLDDLYSFIGGQENLKDNIIKKREELALLERAFPYEKEVANIIKQLNEEAKRFRVNILSLKPRNFYIYKDHQEKELKISDYFCKCMPLTLNVESRYQALGEFLMSLEMNRCPMFSIEEVDIERAKDITPKIRAELDLTAYILGK